MPISDSVSSAAFSLPTTSSSELVQSVQMDVHIRSHNVIMTPINMNHPNASSPPNPPPRETRRSPGVVQFHLKCEIGIANQGTTRSDRNPTCGSELQLRPLPSHGHLLASPRMIISSPPLA
ncbi:hypothetical protein BLNAU_9796 [Blattamonas nauphoetae]|uniref:Uncharacterized protein n=1 Tax=Blattamonas nauphoetae TaxID=2049346 RepID=A0ABQ9XUT6_9EUKA|nr:hypothetical protein BLNAU_9796 [Blattamonas nauphoetae]